MKQERDREKEGARKKNRDRERERERGKEEGYPAGGSWAKKQQADVIKYFTKWIGIP